jgi:hypothetical protein
VAAPPVPPPGEQEEEALAILPLILRSLWQVLAGFFPRLFWK